MSDSKPDQLTELIEALTRANDTLGAAELDYRDRQADEARAAEKTKRAECDLRLATERAEEAERAVHRRIRAMAKGCFDEELTERRCLKALIIKK